MGRHTTLLPLLGAFVTDSVLGRFRTIIVACRLRRESWLLVYLNCNALGLLTWSSALLHLHQKFKNVIVMKCRSSNSEAGLSMIVEYLSTELCDTTSIVEFKLKVGEFQLHVTRDLAEKSAALESPFPAPVTACFIPATTGSDNLELSPPLALTKPFSSSNGVQTILDKATDEGLKILKFPKVRYFRRSRTIEGKRAPPSCKEILLDMVILLLRSFLSFRE